MSDIVLSSGVRSDLPAPQRARDLTEQTQSRPATGNRVTATLENRAVLLTASNTDIPAGGHNRLLDIISKLSAIVASATDRGLIDGIDMPPFAIEEIRNGNSDPSSGEETQPFLFGLINVYQGGPNPPALQVSQEPLMPALSPTVRAEQAVLQFF